MVVGFVQMGQTFGTVTDLAGPDRSCCYVSEEEDNK